ncbi:MAG: hypothetical protein ABH874_05720 [Methanobacteriota archaeon]
MEEDVFCPTCGNKLEIKGKRGRRLTKITVGAREGEPDFEKKCSKCGVGLYMYFEQ